jgi:hypothetical protein
MPNAPLTDWPNAESIGVGGVNAYTKHGGFALVYGVSLAILSPFGKGRQPLSRPVDPTLSWDRNVSLS